jgi:serine/threonine protein kinase
MALTLRGRNRGKTLFGSKVGPFLLGNTLGEGSTSKVKQATHVETGETYAIKIIDLDTLEPAQTEAIDREISLMKLLEHNHLLRLYDVFEGKRKLYVRCVFLVRSCVRVLMM